MQQINTNFTLMLAAAIKSRFIYAKKCAVRQDHANNKILIIVTFQECNKCQFYYAIGVGIVGGNVQIENEFKSAQMVKLLTPPLNYSVFPNAEIIELLKNCSIIAD